MSIKPRDEIENEVFGNRLSQYVFYRRRAYFKQSRRQAKRAINIVVKAMRKRPKDYLLPDGYTNQLRLSAEKVAKQSLRDRPRLWDLVPPALIRKDGRGSLPTPR